MLVETQASAIRLVLDYANDPSAEVCRLGWSHWQLPSCRI
jgi:hypothetical protein